VRACVIEGCRRLWHARGYCKIHYNSARLSGRIETGVKPLRERFMARVRVDAETSCHVWIGPRNTDGYGHIQDKRRTIPAHRLAYEWARGPILKGMHLDHLCRNRSCVNPDHLEPVTCRENIMRGTAPPAQNAAKTHCKRGHPLSGENLYLTRAGKRNCRTCQANRRKEERARGLDRERYHEKLANGTPHERALCLEIRRERQRTCMARLAEAGP
jgi:HNH endonuclease